MNKNKMVRLELQKLKKEEFSELINAALKKIDYSIPYQKDGKVEKKLISRNGRIYLGNNFSIGINQYEDNVFLSIDFFSADDRIELSKKDNHSEFSIK